jgi:hypothetical protein
MVKFIIGLDLGQAQDFTALCVVELKGDPKMKYYHVRHLERFQLGTRYPTIVERVRELTLSPKLGPDHVLVVDATGVGRPVVDLLRGSGLRPVPVIITAGNLATLEGGFWHAPKRDLVSTLQVLLQSSRLRFAEALPQVQDLVDELLAFQVKISMEGRDTYGNDWRLNPHDDMVLSLALACWVIERRRKIKIYHS